MLQDWSHPALLIPGDAAYTVFTSWVRPTSPQCSPGDVPWTTRAQSTDGTEAENESKWATASGPVCAPTSTRTWLIGLHIPHNPSVPSLPLRWPHLFPQNCSHSHANPSPDAEDSPGPQPPPSLQSLTSLCLESQDRGQPPCCHRRLLPAPGHTDPRATSTAHRCLHEPTHSPVCHHFSQLPPRPRPACQLPDTTAQTPPLHCMSSLRSPSREGISSCYFFLKCI